MKRAPNPFTARRGALRILTLAVFGLPAIGALLPTSENAGLRGAGRDRSMALQRLALTPKDSPVADPPSAALIARLTPARRLERSFASPSVQGLTRHLLHQPMVNPSPHSRLAFCSEFTKPDSLRIRLMGTPKNHRSPPA